MDSHGDDVELPLGDDAIDLVSPEGPDQGDPTEDLSATAAAIRGTGDADWIATQATERPAAPVTEQPATEEPVAEQSAADEPVADEPEAEPEPQPDTGRRGSKKKSRASVPSWDEIMFGGGKRE